MKLSLRNKDRQVRDGWKAVFFLLAAMASFGIAGFVGHSLPPAWKAFAPGALLAATLGLSITAAATRLESSSMSSVGWTMDGRFLRQLLQGTLAGGALIALSASALYAIDGLRLTAAPGPGVSVATKMVVVFLCSAIFEELLFRGYAFQRVMRVWGARPAMALFGLLFCVGHLPGNLDVGWWLLSLAMANLFAFAVLLSLLYLRTGSLAMPIGLHFGWNLLQASLGFGVSGQSSSSAWFQVDLTGRPAWLTGGEFGLEASALTLLMTVLAISGIASATDSPSCT
jgi:uncharacterized protein